MENIIFVNGKARFHPHSMIRTTSSERFVPLTQRVYPLGSSSTTLILSKAARITLRPGSTHTSLTAGTKYLPTISLPLRLSQCQLRKESPACQPQQFLDHSSLFLAHPLQMSDLGCQTATRVITYRVYVAVVGTYNTNGRAAPNISFRPSSLEDCTAGVMLLLPLMEPFLC